jgi:hypothetical protein
MTWTCKNCGAEVDDELGICWQCGTGQDGSPPPEGWQSELTEHPKPAPRDLACLRCNTKMAYVGEKRFYEGSYSADILLGDFLSIAKNLRSICALGAARRSSLPRCRRPNSAFKPKLHRYAVNMAETACHVASYALQFGLT